MKVNTEFYMSLFSSSCGCGFKNGYQTKQGGFMKSKILLTIGSLSVAAWLSAGAALAQSPGTTPRDTIGPDASGPSKSGAPSERTGESTGMGKSRAGSSDAAATNGNTGNIKEVQEALKDKGHDPGPVDGIMGARTKEALKSFQTASNLQPSGTLNAETAQKLGVEAGSSTSSGPRGSSRSSDAPSGADQPNQAPSKYK
jgi:peptidoglycan hydrolase-like protein with peptidoglycan-binding domain